MDELRFPPRKRTAASNCKSDALLIVSSDSEEERLVHLHIATIGLGLGFRELVIVFDVMMATFSVADTNAEEPVIVIKEEGVEAEGDVCTSM
jgi:hypothetical protein